MRCTEPSDCCNDLQREKKDKIPFGTIVKIKKNNQENQCIDSVL